MAVGGARVDLGQLYVVLVVMGAASFVGVLGYLQLTWQALPTFSPLAVVFFILVGIFAEKYKISIGKGVEVSAAFLPDFLAATILGPFAAAVVAAGTLPAWFERGNPMRNAFFVSAFTVTSGSTGLVYWLLVGVLPSHLLQIIVGGLVSALCYQACNYLLFMPLMAVRRGIGPKDFFEEAFRPFIPFHLFFLLMSLVLLFSLDRYGASSLVLYLLPALGLVYAFRAFARERDLAQSLEQFSLEMAGSMLTALDLKDNYTGQHSAAVALYAHDMAAELRLPSRERAPAWPCTTPQSASSSVVGQLRMRSGTLILPTSWSSPPRWASARSREGSLSSAAMSWA